MSAPPGDALFAGSVPELYDTLMVPLIFAHYAQDLARRAALLKPQRVLEIAAGTGAVTRCLAAALPASATVVATDLNQPMLDRASAIGTARPVQWRQADALQLPFADAAFDLVLCQFGVMFFPDKARAFAEARRVLAPRGTLLFNVWDRLEHNEFASTVTLALAELYPHDPPRFMARVPHGYFDFELIGGDLRRGGFGAAPSFTTLAGRSRAASAHIPALAYCQGTPLGAEIEARRPGSLNEATAAGAAAIAAKFGPAQVEGGIQAHIVAIAA